MFRLLIACLLLGLSSAANAEPKLRTYWNSQFEYGIAYPSTWTVETQGAFFEQDAFSILNPAKDVNINVMAKRFSPAKRGRYRSITDIPDAAKELGAFLQNENHAQSLRSGMTQLSNEPALWFTYDFAQRSLGHEFWFSAIQLSCLKHDVIYTITAKVSAATQAEAQRKYKEHWPTIERTLATITFTK